MTDDEVTKNQGASGGKLGAQESNSTLPAIVAGTAAAYPLFETPTFAGGGDGALGALKLVPTATQAAQGGTNFVVLNVRQMRAGAALSTVGTLSLGTTALTAEVPVTIPLSAGVQFNAQFAQGDVLDIQAVHTGTGGALPAGAQVAAEWNS